LTPEAGVSGPEPAQLANSIAPSGSR
jgi:hypothetical protein